MTESLSGQQSAARNLVRFQSWVDERRRNDDWRAYVNGEKLSRKDIAAECDFAVSVLRQNPAVKDALTRLEDELRLRKLLPELHSADPVADLVEYAGRPKPESSDDLAAEARAALVAASAAKRVKALEEQNASLRAEIRLLQEKLKRYSLLEVHLGDTGRLLPHE